MTPQKHAWLILAEHVRGCPSCWLRVGHDVDFAEFTVENVDKVLTRSPGLCLAAREPLAGYVLTVTEAA